MEKEVDLCSGSPAQQVIDWSLDLRHRLESEIGTEPRLENYQYAGQEGENHQFGHQALREAIARDYGLGVEGRDRVFLGDGVRSNLSLVLSFLRSRDSIVAGKRLLPYEIDREKAFRDSLVAVPAPYYFRNLQNLLQNGFFPLPIPVDGHGLADEEITKHLLAAGVKKMLLSRVHINPSGASLAEFPSLLDLCARAGVTLVADDVYDELNYANNKGLEGGPVNDLSLYPANLEYFWLVGSAKTLRRPFGAIVTDRVRTDLGDFLLANRTHGPDVGYQRLLAEAKKREVTIGGGLEIGLQRTLYADHMRKVLDFYGRRMAVINNGVKNIGQELGAQVFSVMAEEVRGGFFRGVYVGKDFFKPLQEELGKEGVKIKPNLASFLDGAAAQTEGADGRYLREGLNYFFRYSGLNGNDDRAVKMLAALEPPKGFVPVRLSIGGEADLDSLVEGLQTMFSKLHNISAPASIGWREGRDL